jgi:hypothetical protein
MDSSPAVQNAAVQKVFDGAHDVVSALWTGMNPEEAKKNFDLPEDAAIEIVREPESLFDKEICILGFKKGTNQYGDYWTFLFIPKQEKVALGFFSLSSLPFLGMIERSKLPVKGVLEKVVNKKNPKKTYWNLK